MSPSPAGGLTKGELGEHTDGKTNSFREHSDRACKNKSHFGFLC